MHTPAATLYLTAAGLTLAVCVAFSLWSRRHGAQVVQKWAAQKGLQATSVKRRSFTPHWGSLSSRGFQFFRVTLRRSDGENYKAWLRLESDCTNPEMLDVIWDDKEPSVQ